MHIYRGALMLGSQSLHVLSTYNNGNVDLSQPRISHLLVGRTYKQESSWIGRQDTRTVFEIPNPETLYNACPIPGSPRHLNRLEAIWRGRGDGDGHTYTVYHLTKWYDCNYQVPDMAIKYIKIVILSFSHDPPLLLSTTISTPRRQQ